MSAATGSVRQRFWQGSVLALIAVGAGAGIARAQPAPASNAANVSDNAAPPHEDITVKVKKRLIRERNSPSAVSELVQAQANLAGIAGSVATLLRQAPSVYVYQQGLGDNAPELTIRGIRGLETAATLDDVPMQDLLAPKSFYLANNIGSYMTLTEIGGVSIYPGVAYPDKNTFGTIGGTIAYQTLRPSNDYALDLTGSIGSFGTYKEGFSLNSGSLDSPLGTGDNAVKMLLSYNNFQSQGFIENTWIRENEMEFALDKPYDDGLSKFQGTVLFNTGSGLVENEAVPVAYLDKYGLFSNYPTSEDFAKQDNNYLTVILKDNHYINDYLTVGVTVFYLADNNNVNNYGNINLMAPGGMPGPLTVNGISPFLSNPAGLGYGGLYGPPVGNPLTDPSGVTRPIGFYGVGPGYGGVFYGKFDTYNPFALYPIGSKDCPTALANLYASVRGNAHLAPCGLNDEISGVHSDTYGIQPRVEILPPEFWGINNTIKIGALLAKETSPTGYEYLGGDPNTPMDAAHAAQTQVGGVERTIYQAYVQDKLDVFDNTLHVTPGVTLEGTYSSDVGYLFGALDSPIYGPDGLYGPNGYYVRCMLPNGNIVPGCKAGNLIDQYGAYKGTKWDRDFLPFLNIAYDFDKIVPSASGLSIYGSAAESALFAPTTTFEAASPGGLPSASIVHIYEGGIKYDTSDMVLTADYFYQRIDRDLGYYVANEVDIWNNDGQREYKGFETYGTYQLTPRLQLFGSASYVMAHWMQNDWTFLTVAEDQYGFVRKGDPITGVPNWLSIFGVNYEQNNLVVDDDAVSMRVAGQYIGHQNTTTDITASQATVQGLPGVQYYNPGGGYCGYCVYNTEAGATVYDPHGGIKPTTIFNLDIGYTLPTPQLPVLKNIHFDLNVQNLLDTHYWQYFYKQIAPASCGVFTSGPYKGQPQSAYGCTPEFADGIPGEPLGAFFTVTARF